MNNTIKSIVLLPTMLLLAIPSLADPVLVELLKKEAALPKPHIAPEIADLIMSSNASALLDEETKLLERIAELERTLKKLNAALKAKGVKAPSNNNNNSNNNGGLRINESAPLLGSVKNSNHDFPLQSVLVLDVEADLEPSVRESLQQRYDDAVADYIAYKRVIGMNAFVREREHASCVTKIADLTRRIRLLKKGKTDNDILGPTQKDLETERSRLQALQGFIEEEGTPLVHHLEAKEQEVKAPKSNDELSLQEKVAQEHGAIRSADAFELHINDCTPRFKGTFQALENQVGRLKELIALKKQRLQGENSQLAALAIAESILTNEREIALIECIFKLQQELLQNGRSAADIAALKSQAEIEEEIRQVQEDLKIAQLSYNAAVYESLARAMSAVSQAILAQIKTGQSYDSEVVKPLRKAHVTLMRQFETFEFDFIRKTKGNALYPDTTFGPEKRRLMREYELALNGVESSSEGYWTTVKGLLSKLGTVLSSRNEAKLTKYLSINQIKESVKGLDRFLMDHPIIAIEMMHNLMLTYEILAENPNNGFVAALLADIKTIYKVKEVENIARDWLMGTEDYLCCEQNISRPPLPLGVITFVDFVEKAPYLAGAMQGAQGAGAIPKLVDLALQFTPNPVRTAGLAITGVGQVHLQKLAISKISREHELLVSGLRHAFDDYAAGKGPKEIVASWVKYNVMRKAIQVMGTTRRIMHYGGTGELWYRFTRCVWNNVFSGYLLGAGIGFGVGYLTSYLLFHNFDSIPDWVIDYLPAIGPVVFCLPGVLVADSIKDCAFKGRREEHRLKVLARRLKHVNLLDLDTTLDDEEKVGIPCLDSQEASGAVEEMRAASDQIDFEELGKLARCDRVTTDAGLEEVLTIKVGKQMKLNLLSKKTEEFGKSDSEIEDDLVIAQIKAALKQLKTKGLSNEDMSSLVKTAIDLLGETDELSRNIVEMLVNFEKIATNGWYRGNLDKQIAAIDAIETEVRQLRKRQLAEQMALASNELKGNGEPNDNNK